MDSFFCFCFCLLLRFICLWPLAEHSYLPPSPPPPPSKTITKASLIAAAVCVCVTWPLDFYDSYRFRAGQTRQPPRDAYVCVCVSRCATAVSILAGSGQGQHAVTGTITENGFPFSRRRRWESSTPPECALLSGPDVSAGTRRLDSSGGWVSGPPSRGGQDSRCHCVSTCHSDVRRAAARAGVTGL